MNNQAFKQMMICIQCENNSQTNGICKGCIRSSFFKAGIEDVFVKRVYCEDCKHSEPQDERRVFCELKGKQKNKKSFCEAMEK